MPESKNVKDLLEEIKNLSGLMLNLAYSSVFLESKEIAKEVIILYNNIEDSEESLYLHLFAASRGRDARKLISVIDVVESSKFVANAARNMAEMVLEGSQLHPVIKDALKQSDESISITSVLARSMLAGKSLGEMKMRTNTGADIIAIKRGSNWIFDPKKFTILQKDDTLIFVGSKESCRLMNKLAKGEVKKI